MARGRKAAAHHAEPIEGLWDLPDDWCWERLETVAPINPKRSFDSLPDDAELTFLGMASVAELSGVLNLSEVRPREEVRSGFTRFQSGDVIFAKITPCMENGKLAIIPDLPHKMGAGSTEFHVLEPQQVTARFLFHWLSQETFRNRAEHNMTGTAGQKRVPTHWLRGAPIPVPPTSVAQEAIVGRIDTLLAEIDRGEAALAEARTGVETYRKTLLKAAVTGELTADWRQANPPQETGEQLLARILAHRRTRWEAEPKNSRKKYVEPTGPDTYELPELPEGWAWASLDQLCSHITSGSRAWSRYYDQGKSVFVMAQNVRAGRYDDRTTQFVGPPENDPERRRTRIFNGDLLLTIVGANTGDLCQVKFQPADHYVCQSVALLRPDHTLLGQMVELFFSTPFGRNLQMNQMIYGAGRPHLSFEDIRKLSVPIPPESEIEPILVAARKAIERAPSSETLADASAAAATLRQSILAAAFRGELVA